MCSKVVFWRREKPLQTGSSPPSSLPLHSFSSTTDLPSLLYPLPSGNGHFLPRPNGIGLEQNLRKSFSWHSECGHVILVSLLDCLGRVVVTPLTVGKMGIVLVKDDDWIELFIYFVQECHLAAWTQFWEQGPHFCQLVQPPSTAKHSQCMKSKDIPICQNCSSPWLSIVIDCSIPWH